MGPLAGQSGPVELPAAGELLAVEALDRTGVLVTSEGALVRYLQVAAKNPLVMARDERAQVADAFGRLIGRLDAGQSLQFYVEARPVQLDELLDQSRAQAETAARALERTADEDAAARAAALRALHGAQETSLRIHAQHQAAVEVGYYLVVPYPPVANVPQLDWEALVPGRRRLRRSALTRALASHRRVLRESLAHTDGLRADLEALDLSTHLLSGPEVAALLSRRLNPAAATQPDPSRPQRLEVLGELDVVRGAAQAAAAALRLRAWLAGSAIDLTDQRYLRVDRDLEQVVYLGGPPDATHFGWLLEAMQITRPFALSVHVHALDRLRERSRYKARHRRLFGINRGAEARGRVADFEMLAQEHEVSHLVQEISGQQRAATYQVAVYQAIREPGPEPDPVQLAQAVDQAARALRAASDAHVHLGQFLQEPLWQSSLPLGRDVAGRTHRYITRNVADTIPLVGTSCGSPAGIPFAFADPGRTVERLDPFDPAHDNHTLLVNGKSGAGKTFVVNVLLARLLAHGASGHVFDRAGHYQFLTSLVPGARHITIGAGDGEHAVNPWDTPEPANPPNTKIAFLVGLHALLVGDQRPGDGTLGISPLERNLLEVAIRGVYTRAHADGFAPRESHLQEELVDRAQREAASGAGELAGVLRTLAERLQTLTGAGSHAYLLDRETTVPGDAPLVVFDTRKVPRELAGAVMFTLAEHVTAQIEAARMTERAIEEGSFAGRRFLVIDEAWKLVEHVATGEWVNDWARRGRHHGLFLVAISQQLSDFAGPYGKALLRNSTQQLFLRQSPDELRYVQDTLRLSDEEIRAIARLKTAKRDYSQAYWINGTRGRGTITLRVGPVEYWLATSDPLHDVPARERALRATDEDAWAALQQLAERSGDAT